MLLGATFQVSSNIKLRTDITYDQTTTTTTTTNEEHRSMSIPNSNHIWISRGLNYSFNEQASIHLGTSIIQGNTEKLTEKNDLGQQWTFESQDDVYIVSAQYKHIF